MSMMTPEPSELPVMISLADYERAAEALLDSATFGYYAGGAGDELTLRDNVAAWQRLAIIPRTLVGVADRDPGVELLGHRRAHPLIVAPMAAQALVHEQGELATARAAAASQAILCLSTLASFGLEEVAAAGGDGARWFQLYVFADRGIGRELMAQAAAHGFEALVVTADRPLLGGRERELRAPVAVAHRTGGVQGPMRPVGALGRIDPDLRWSDIEAFASESPLPVLVKGILSPEDALLAAEHGARGVIVSNHGGRQLDTVLSGADALAPIVDAVGERLDVLVDGGIRRGIDVLKALALGARAVMIGRPVLWGLAVDGAAGAQRVLDILREELDIALALAGCPSASELGRELLVPAPWASS